MSTLKIKVFGTTELKANLDGLARKVRRDILKRAVAGNTGHMLASIKEAAPKGETGKLERSIKRRVRVDARKVSATATIYASPTIAPHAMSVEFGTAPRTKNSTGQYVGEMPANPFMRSAFESEAAQTGADIIADVAAQIEVEAGKP